MIKNIKYKIKDIFLKTASMPLSGFLYRKIYSKAIKRGVNIFKKVVDECVSNGINKFNLNFYNEPFLDPMIFERIEYLKLKGVRVQLFSNGSVLDDDKIDKIIKSGLNDIKFSVDG